MNELTTSAEAPVPDEGRRRFAPAALMVAGLAAGYGAFAAIAARFLYPSGGAVRRWQFVARVQDIEPGGSVSYRTPQGARVNVARRGNGNAVEDFIALSSTCPHLGCQVHWEPQNNRFFCPCHNGVFTPDGVATEGPPADAGQRLPSYPIKVEDGLLYVEVSTEKLAHAHEIVDDAPPGPGKDPCLSWRFPGDRAV